MGRALGKICLSRLLVGILFEASQMMKGVGYIHNMHDYDK